MTPDTMPTTPFLDFDPPCSGPPDPLEQAALAFHRANPHVLHAILGVCLEVRRKGWTHWSIGAAFEVVRYRNLNTNGKVYKLNNNHRAHYARWIMRDVPELADFFSTREQGRVAQEAEA